MDLAYSSSTNWLPIAPGAYRIHAHKVANKYSIIIETWETKIKSDNQG